MRSAIVVGGGIVGLATAWTLLQDRPGLRLTLLEKENDVGRHQSTHNSGVLHCGLPYRPGSLKARLAVRGIRLMVAFCREHGIPHEICGKLVVAADETEIPRLDELGARGEANGLVGLRRLDPAAMREREPHVGGAAGLLVPEEGIVDYGAVCGRLAELVREGGGEIHTGRRVARIERSAGEWIAHSAEGEEHRGEWLVNCAGLHSDRLATLAGLRRPLRIVPFRGEYRRIRPERRGLVRHLIYPVPDPGFPFLGVHFTRTIAGELEAGPNAVLAFAREGYRARDVDLRDLFDALVWPGLWRFLLRHPRMVAVEVARTASRRVFCGALRRLVPDLRPGDLLPGQAGVRAQAMTPSGELEGDFRLLREEHALHVLNAPSPAATASLAIAEHLVRELGT